MLPATETITASVAPQRRAPRVRSDVREPRPSAALRLVHAERKAPRAGFAPCFELGARGGRVLEEGGHLRRVLRWQYDRCSERREAQVGDRESIADQEWPAIGEELGDAGERLVYLPA